MSRDSGAGAGSVVLAFLVGAVAGAAVALLYAPATGRETRDLLSEKAREGRDRANEAAVRGREAVNRGRETVANAIERGREAYQQARSTAASREGA
ncbi:MAG TPA: YtxH domain-containing protein [Vicinamibacterales bacterium]|nr:YtxH domain-containing protein [Vicinamibacterales bacterium]